MFECNSQSQSINLEEEVPFQGATIRGPLAGLRQNLRARGTTGSDVCHEIYRASSVFGRALNNDQKAFCFFEDGSMIELNSLTTYLHKQGYVQ